MAYLLLMHVIRNVVLLLAYEKTGYDVNAKGRLPDCLVEWSAKRLKRTGR